MEARPHAVTQLLLDWNEGSEQALDQLIPLVYQELRRLAQHALAGERDSGLDGTVLVHETYLKLIDQRRVRWRNRAHFFALAGRLMRRILVDHARRRRAAKRGGGRPLTLVEGVTSERPVNIDLIALDEALNDLCEFDKRQASIVEMRFFSGLTVRETAAVMEISPATVKREWSMAKAWLFGRLASAPA